jgi:hypothetical protein
MTTFYRLHTPAPDAPCFCADHAYSASPNEVWSADGSRTECPQCNGSGQYPGIVTCRCGKDPECERCDGAGYMETDRCGYCAGEGWRDAWVGYSACHSPAELVAYLATSTYQRQVADDEAVVVFEGQRVGDGPDNEPLVIPTGDVKWITWGELVKLATNDTEPVYRYWN